VSTREALLDASDRDAFLVRHSNLPGPRANLELAALASDAATAEEAARWAASDDEYLALCGAMATARLGDDALLRRLANDARWRVREGVALGLQRHRADDPEALVRLLDDWTRGSDLERRAAVATLAEPPLLRDPVLAAAALDVLDRVTADLAASPDRRADGFRALRKALGYAWSVVVAAGAPEARARFEALLASADPDVRWVVRENLKKARLERLDAAWVASLRARAVA
jgi:hypothetical protein